MSITKSITLNSLNLCVFLSTVLSSLGFSHLGGALGFLTLSEFSPYLLVYALFLSFSFSYVKVWISTKRCKKNCGNQPPKCTITKESPNNGQRLLIIFFKRITDLSSYQHLSPCHFLEHLNIILTAPNLSLSQTNHIFQALIMSIFFLDQNLKNINLLILCHYFITLSDLTFSAVFREVSLTILLIFAFIH